MSKNNVNLPYFDAFLDILDQGNEDFVKAFGRHVHWGYWVDPHMADLSVDGFAASQEEMCARIFGMLPIKTGSSILDVGCGFGGTISSLNDIFSDLRMTGLNIDPRQIERAISMVAPKNNNIIDFVCGNACNLPFADQTFDIVIAAECIFHFPSREDFFREARRVLNPGGILFVSDIIPTQALLSLRQLILPWLGPELQKSFGDINFDITIKGYEQLAKKHRLESTKARDITVNTLPTHALSRHLYQENAPDLYEQQQLQMRSIEVLSKLRLLRYYLMTWSCQYQE